MFFEMFGQMKKQLSQMDTWLEAASTYAKSRSFDPNVLVTFRLAPDMLPFARQIQIACDTAKLAAARLSGKEAPSQADSEQTIDELRARVRAVLTYLDGFTAADFGESMERRVTQPRWEGKWMTGADYFLQHAVPNFYFHIAHAYAILRHNGVPLGKRDYLGNLNLRA